MLILWKPFDVNSNGVADTLHQQDPTRSVFITLLPVGIGVGCVAS